MEQNQPPFHSSTVQFQIPQFALGGTPNLAHGGGAEAIPGMYGQGAQAWSDYDKYWFDNPGPSKYYSLSELVAEPPSRNSPKPSQTPRPFEFNDSPQLGPREGASITPPGMDIEEDEPSCGSSYLGLPPSNPLSFPHPAVAAPFPQYPALSLSALTFPDLNTLDPTAPLPPIPSNGLPLYSASGFDMLKILGKVATRPNPKIMLGPVDMTCSFVVVDIRRFDAPIVYASPTFTRLTGYPESEVLGRNCRFLQAPSGRVERGEDRQFTAPDAVRHLQKCLLQEKECQASLINYRKDGGAFINLITVIPVSVEDGSDEVTHHVGFQVDLAEQPNAILQKLRDGSYIVNYSSAASGSSPFGIPRESRRGRGVSQDMIALLRAGKPWALAGGEPGAKPVRDQERADLHAMLLENTDDFIHVVSLKGALLYVAPSVQRVLGYDPADLVGKSIVDICHAADTVPLMRELKEASSSAATGHPPVSDETTVPANPLFALQQQQQQIISPKPVNLLFRALHKNGGYVWLEARGRLHVEQGKGRKAVVLVGRRTNMPSLRWGAVPLGESDAECWGLVAPNGLVLSASGTGAERLGYGEDGAELVGRSLASLVNPEESRRVGEVLAGAACADKGETRRVQCELLMKTEEGRPMRTASAEIVFYAHERDPDPESLRSPSLPPSLVFQISFMDTPRSSASPPNLERSHSSETLKSVLRILPSAPPPAPLKRLCTSRPPDANVLEELDTTRETSWQYELTRLRFENQRMQEEVGKLERMQRTQHHLPYLRRHMGLYGEGSVSPTASSSSSGIQARPHPPTLQHALPTTITLPPAPGQKRTRDGELKLPSPT